MLVFEIYLIHWQLWAQSLGLVVLKRHMHWRNKQAVHMWIFFDFILKKKKSVVAFSFCIIKITSKQVINVFDRDKYKSKVIWYIGCKHTTTTCHLTLFQFLFALVCTETGKDLLYVHSGMKGEIMSWQEKKTLIQFPIYLLFIHTLTWHDLGVGRYVTCGG